MKKLVLLAGAAGFAFGPTALTKPGKGLGKQAKSHAAKPHGKPSQEVVYISGGRLFALDARASCLSGFANKGNHLFATGK